VGERIWFFNVGLSGKDGTLKRKWPVKTLETLLKENKHIDVSKRFLILLFVQLICDARGVLKGGQGVKTSGYATWFTAGSAIRIAHYDVIGDVITRKLLRDREKRRPSQPMKSSELSNGENRIALRQLL